MPTNPFDSNSDLDRRFGPTPEARGQAATYAALKSIAEQRSQPRVPVQKSSTPVSKMVAVFDASGQLMGLVDPKKLLPLSTDAKAAIVRKALARPRQPSAIRLLTVLGSMTSSRVRKGQGADPLTAGILKFAQMGPVERAKFTAKLAKTTPQSRAVLSAHLSDQRLRGKD